MHTYLATLGLVHQSVDVTPEAPAAVTSGLIRLLRWAMWLGMLSGIAAIIYGGGRILYDRINPGWDPEAHKVVVGALIGGIVITTATTLMNTIVLT